MSGGEGSLMGAEFGIKQAVFYFCFIFLKINAA